MTFIGVIFSLIGTVFLSLGIVFFVTGAPSQEELPIPLIFLLFGLIFGGIGAFITAKVIRRAKEKKWLKQFGIRVEAEFKSVDKNRSVRVNGKSPYRIYAQWLHRQSNTVFMFESDDIWFDPEPFIKTKEIGVLIDPQDPKKNYMDISFLPKAGKGLFF